MILKSTALRDALITNCRCADASIAAVPPRRGIQVVVCCATALAMTHEWMAVTGRSTVWSRPMYAWAQPLALSHLSAALARHACSIRRSSCLLWRRRTVETSTRRLKQREPHREIAVRGCKTSARGDSEDRGNTHAGRQGSTCGAGVRCSTSGAAPGVCGFGNKTPLPAS